MPKKSAPTDRTAAMILAERLRAGLAKDPDFRLDDLPQETQAAAGPSAIFHVIGPDGRTLRIRVIPQ